MPDVFQSLLASYAKLKLCRHNNIISTTARGQTESQRSTDSKHVLYSTVEPHFLMFTGSNRFFDSRVRASRERNILSGYKTYKSMIKSMIDAAAMLLKKIWSRF